MDSATKEATALGRSEMEAARAHYAEHFELAPVGYGILTLCGLIREINLTGCRLLGADRETLINAPFSRYIAPDSQDAYKRHQQALQADRGPHSCELHILRGDGSDSWLNITCAMTAGDDGNPVCRMILHDVTEVVNARAALADAETKYRQLYQSMMDGYVQVDMDGRLLDWNKEYQKMLGYADEELRNLTYQQLTPAKWHEMERRLVEEQIVPRGYSDLYEKEYVRANGEVFPVELRTSMIRDSDGKPGVMWAIVRDITSRKRDEEILREWNQSLELRVTERTAELAESEDRYRRIAEATFEGLAISMNGILVDVNPQLAAMYHCDAARMIGRPVMDFIAPESRKLVSNRIAAGDERAYEYLGLREDGTRVPMEAQGRMMNWKGGRKRVTAIRDLTQKKKAEADIAAQKAALDEAMRLAMISEISAGIVHQLSQPVTAIMLGLVNAENQMKACDSKTCGSPKILAALQAEVSRMIQAMNHLRALADPAKPKRLAFDFNQMISEQVGINWQMAMDQGISLQVTLDDSIPTVYGDAVQLAQAVNNLIRNACEACRDIPQERRSVAVTTRSTRDGGVELCVVDTGTGIPPDVVSHLFSPFFTTKVDGLGIGLRLSRTIVEAHGGQIKAVSDPDGVGTTFCVVLPVNPPGDYTKV